MQVKNGAIRMYRHAAATELPNACCHFGGVCVYVCVCVSVCLSVCLSVYRAPQLQLVFPKMCVCVCMHTYI
jgi:hypothetical protein